VATDGNRREPLERVRVGMVGAGFMAKVHSLAYRDAVALDFGRVPELELVRIADLDPERAQETKARFGWREATADWRKILEDPEIDLVDIVTPNHLHAEIAVEAARAGKHVLCEKPLASDVTAAQEMADAVRDAGVASQVGFVFRKWPAVCLARELIDSGRLGRILDFRGHYFHDYALDSELPMDWRVDRNLAGAGSVGDLGSHVIDLARYLVGDVSRVFASTRTVIPERAPSHPAGPFRVDVDDAADCLLEFASGARGTLATSWMTAGHKTDVGFEISGDAGTVRFTWRRSGELMFYDHADPEEHQGFRTIYIGPKHHGAERFWPVAGQGLGYGDAFTILIAELLGGLRTGGAITPDFSDGLRAVEFVEAAQVSNEREAWIELESASTAGVRSPTAVRR
jgi:predicted dehydrogenase